MIDLSENVVTLAEASKFLPKRAGKKIHVATVYRWAQRGINGVRLEVLQVGGTKCTSTEALSRFFAKLGGDGAETAPPQLSRERRASIAAAERELNEAGI